MTDLLKLFERYMNEGKVSEALLVGQNMFNKYSGDREVFQKYIGILLDLAKDYHAPVAVCRNYCGKAEIAVEFYAENARLDEDVIDEILKKKESIYEILSNLDERELEESKAFEREISSDNERTLNLVKKLNQKLAQVTQKVELDKVLKQIQQLDGVLEKEYFTERQETLYQQLSKECANLVDVRIRYLNHRKEVEYNLKAIETYEKAYQMLKNAKNPENCMDVIKDFFIFDASRLFNETLVYYNHVYSYILGKMDDAGKYNLTKLAVQCEKKYMA